MLCLAMDILLLLPLAPAGFCLSSRCLVIGLYVIIFNFLREKASPLGGSVTLDWYPIIPMET
jgi:hypothetical protein